MDENKEILNSAEENNPEEVTDTEPEELSLEAEESDIEAPDIEAEAQKTALTAPIKKPLIQLPIIISFAIVAVVLIVFLAMKCFFNTSIVGTWTVDTSASTADEATAEDYNLTYYTFEDDNTLTITQGTVKMVAEYQTYEDEDGVRYMYSAVFSEEYAYSVSGNAFGGRKLILSSSSYTGALTSARIKQPELKAADGFKPDEKLTGKWSIPDYGISYEFKDDGTFLFNQSDVYFYEGTYTYTDEELELTYYAGTEMSVSASYALDGDNVLVINGLGYYRTNADGSLVATVDELY